MPPLSISEDELRQLIQITAESIETACSSLNATPIRLAQVA
jgi:adenosylmethionine-8-amino-7-oxononanoate aminotransferase